jgi:hypothetical protein
MVPPIGDKAQQGDAGYQDEWPDGLQDCKENGATED